MRPVSGLDRPTLQWLFVLAALALVVVVAAETIVITRSRARLEAARAAELNAKLDRQQLELELARERRGREAASMEAARLRAGAQVNAEPLPPTLTLTPAASRAAIPPAPSVELPERLQVIELRLLLPLAAPRPPGPYAVAIRRWTTGETLWTRAGLSSGAERPPAVAALITGDLLGEGSYEVLLRSTSPPPDGTDVATYEVSIGPRKAPGSR